MFWFSQSKNNFRAIKDVYFSLFFIIWICYLHNGPIYCYSICEGKVYSFLYNLSRLAVIFDYDDHLWNSYPAYICLFKFNNRDIKKGVIYLPL